MADSKSTLAFGRAAVSFEVHESDFLVMAADKISTFEAMAYRLPASADLEDYLKKVLRKRGAYRDVNGEIVVYDKPTILSWDDYKCEPDTGCLRKLWGLSTQVAKRQLERLAGEEGEGKTKITLAHAQELEDKAVETGMPEATSDRERPSLHTLTKVQMTFMPSGTFQHLAWESYVSMEVESRLRRAGKLPKDKKELVVDGKSLKMTDTDVEFPETVVVDNLVALQDLFELRARAFHILDVCKYDVMKAYGERIVACLRGVTAEGMRNPTMNEARRADREIFSEILKWVAKGKGSVEAGLSHYTREFTTEPLWKLLSQQPEGHPDQGKERPSTSKSTGEDKKGTKRSRTPERAAKDRSGEPPKLRMCIVCRKRHEPRCQIPPGFRKEQKQWTREKRRHDEEHKKEKGGKDGKK